MSTIKSVQLPNGDTYNLSGAPVSGASAPLIKNIQLPNGDTYNIGTDLITPLTVTENGTYTPEEPYNGFSSVTVNVSGGVKPELVMDNLRLPYGEISGTNLTIDPSKVTMSGTDLNIGDATIIYDEDLIPSNIKKDVDIFGVVGTYEGSGVLPTGNINITDMSEYDVTEYATAQVVDADLIASNIKEGVNILGITGTVHEGITPSGNLEITDLNSHDVTNYETAQIVDSNITADNIKEGINILGVTGTLASGAQIQYSNVFKKVSNTTSYTDCGCTITVEKSGTYKCSWVHYAYASSSSYYLTRLYVNGSAVGTTHSAPAYNGSSGWSVSETNISLNAGDTVSVYARSRSGSSYYTVAGNLIIEKI